MRSHHLLTFLAGHADVDVVSLVHDAAEDHCAKAGSRFMDLRIVNVRKELPSFYHDRGYVETGTEPFPPDLSPKLPCHFVTMSKSLSHSS